MVGVLTHPPLYEIQTSVSCVDGFGANICYPLCKNWNNSKWMEMPVGGVLILFMNSSKAVILEVSLCQYQDRRNFSNKIMANNNRMIPDGLNANLNYKT